MRKPFVVRLPLIPRHRTQTRAAAAAYARALARRAASSPHRQVLLAFGPAGAVDPASARRSTRR